MSSKVLGKGFIFRGNVLFQIYFTQPNIYPYYCRFLLVEFLDHKPLFLISDLKSFFPPYENSSSYFRVSCDLFFSFHSPSLLQGSFLVLTEIHHWLVCHFYWVHLEMMIVALFSPKVAIKKKKEMKVELNSLFYFMFIAFLSYFTCQYFVSLYHVVINYIDFINGILCLLLWEELIHKSHALDSRNVMSCNQIEFKYFEHIKLNR